MQISIDNVASEWTVQRFKQALYTAKNAPPVAWQTGFLFCVDAFTNVADYGFHVFVGRSLAPGDFAIIQTINASLMIVFTAFAVLQPVVARFVAESEAAGTHAAAVSPHARAIFQQFFRYSILIGAVLTLAALSLQRTLAEWLNVPQLAVMIGSLIVLFAVMRSVVAGVLHGQQRFIAYGVTRSLYSMGRLGVAVVVILAGMGAFGVIAAYPLGMLLTVLGGLVLLGRSIWQPANRLPDRYVRDGIRLSAGAFVAYAAYTLLLNHDMIWVNRVFDADVAGGYATAVLLRRVLVLIPGAVIAVMYPRVVETITQDRVPDMLLTKTFGIIVASTLTITIVFFAVGSPLIELTFGDDYAVGGPLLGWMGLAMLGYTSGSVWLNFYLATRPAPFVAVLVGAAVAQGTLLMLYHDTLLHVTAAFAIGGWILALAGLGLYIFWMRPRLAAGVVESEHSIAP